jgi:hypothetical protein
VPPRAGARVEEVDAGAGALPPAIGVAVVDVVAAGQPLLEVRGLAVVAVAALFDVERQTVHHLRRPQHHLDLLGVQIVEQLREVAVALAGDERVVVGLPRAIEHDDADRRVAVLEALHERIGVGVVGDVLGDPWTKGPPRRVRLRVRERRFLGRAVLLRRERGLLFATARATARNEHERHQRSAHRAEL